MKFTVSIVLALFATLAFSQEPGTPPIDAFRANTQLGMLLCQATALDEFARNEMGAGPGPEGSLGACIKKQKTEGLTYLKPALSAAKKAGAKEALKNYAATWSAGLDGISPALSETKIDYRRRQAAMTDRLNQAWARFEVER